MSFDSIQRLLDSAAREGRFALLEHEVYALLGAAGCRVPRHVLVRPGERMDPKALKGLEAERVVLKIVSPQIAHKTDVGGVAKCAAEPRAIEEGVARMLDEVPRRFAQLLEASSAHRPEPYLGLAGKALEDAIRRDVRGVLVVEMVACEGEGPGSEVIVALRHNREFGPVVTMGVGGIDTELLGEACRKGQAVVSASALAEPQAMLEAFRPTLAHRRLAGLTRAGRRLVADSALLQVFEAFKRIGTAFGQDGDASPSGAPSSGGAWTITELEVNPFAAARGELVALDGLLKFRARAPLPLARPLGSMEHLMRPQSLAVVGVSAKGMNMGRIILNNLFEEGFDRSRAYVIRPDCDQIDGAKCVPSIRDLPERVDLFVVAVGADQVPGIMEELVEHDKAVGVILIPGGMGEKAGGEVIEARIKAALRRARELGRPLVANGGNCLGIVSRPGRYHTLFVPRKKLPLPVDGKGNAALISQSGAYMISRMSKLGWMSPRYAVSTGNQVDLTLSDFLRFLSEDPAVRTFGVYVEGFKDGDGLAFVKAVREVVASGRDVIIYKAGRTAEGKTATSGHTASLAGDYDVFAALLAQAGAMVARTFAEHQALMCISSLLGDKEWNGNRLAALSNAGYEAVGIADNLRGEEGGGLKLATFGAETTRRLQSSLERNKLHTLVDVHNPFDLTPMANDEAHEDAVRAFLDDPGVDVVLCSTIPITAMMATLGDDAPEAESIRAPGSLVNRLGRIIGEAKKPIVVSIDSGVLYDPMARALEAKGLPTFRSADEAVRAIGIYAANRIARR